MPCTPAGAWVSRPLLRLASRAAPPALGLGQAGVGRWWARGARKTSHPSCLAAPSRQRTDRPVSSEGRFSQPNAAHLPSASEMAAGREMPLDMPPGEGLEEPTRGPRSTTAH